MEPYSRCLWLIDLLSNESLTFKEISDRWEHCGLNDDRQPLNRRTFFRDKEYIGRIFHIEIAYNMRYHTYTVDSQEGIGEQSILRYSLEHNRFKELAQIAQKMQSKVVLEPLATGSEHLVTLLKAIEQKRMVTIEYVSFYEPTTVKHFELIPCFVRLFERRWYLIGEFADHTQQRVLALERMRSVQLKSEKALPSHNMGPEKFYAGCFGIIHDNKQPEWIKFKVYGPQADYLRTMPLHDSQEEIETTAEYALFQIHVRPSFDLVQQLLWNRESIEVVAPSHFREEMRQTVQRMLDRYNVSFSDKR